MSAWLDQFVELVKNDTLRIVLILLLIFFFWMLELVVPAQPRQSMTGRIRNMGYIVLFLGLGMAMLAAIFLVGRGTPHVIDVTGVQVVLLFLAGVVLSDLLFYAYHRAQHSWSWLWPLHELHHSDAELNATSSMRSYWLEYPIQVLIISVPTHVIVGVTSQTVLWSTVILTSWLFFTHANLRLSLGPLTPVVSGPQLHRIHHSIESHHQNKNFAQFFPVIDKIFGTYYPPARDEFPGTGTESLTTDAPYGTTLVRPFRLWLNMLRNK